MKSPESRSPVTNPLDALATSVEARSHELSLLLQEFEPALTLVEDLGKINDIITASPRPDLTLEQPVQQREISFPFKYSQVSNFIPNLRSFGPRVYQEEYDYRDKKMGLRPNGRKLPTEKELSFYFSMGALGTYEDYQIFGKAHNIDEDALYEVLHQTHLPKPAFMRMWILFPTLTERIMRNCLDDRTNDTSHCDEEIFVAYTLMSKLVDAKDPYVTKGESTFDDLHLYH